MMMSKTNDHGFCAPQRAKDRTEIIAWTTTIESELRDWAERLTVVDYNFLRMCLDDAAHRALYSGYADHQDDILVRSC
jgi:hypothetical protein